MNKECQELADRLLRRFGDQRLEERKKSPEYKKMEEEAKTFEHLFAYLSESVMDMAINASHIIEEKTGLKVTEGQFLFLLNLPIQARMELDKQFKASKTFDQAIMVNVLVEMFLIIGKQDMESRPEDPKQGESGTLVN